MLDKSSLKIAYANKCVESSCKIGFSLLFIEVFVKSVNFRLCHCLCFCVCVYQSGTRCWSSAFLDALLHSLCNINPEKPATPL